MDTTQRSLLESTYPLALEARVQGRRFIRIEVEPRRGMLQRYVILWDSAIAKVVGRKAIPAYGAIEAGSFEVDKLIVEVGVTDVIEAFNLWRTRDVEFAKVAQANMPANRLTPPAKVTTTR